MTNLLSSFIDNLQTGGFTFILGMLVIFLGMSILVFAISLVGKIITKSDEKTAAKVAEKKDEKVDVPQVETVSNDDEIPENVRVAIIAAIAAYYTQSGAKNEFKVRKIKKI